MPASDCGHKPWWHQERIAVRLDRLRQRSLVTAATRAFFDRRGFLEVETPILQVSPGLEPHLHAFRTEWTGADPAERRPLTLHTSPEFAMKKLLAGGLARIVQFARVFRNRERSPTHHPEFTMLEWYRAGADYRDLMADCRDLVRTAAAVLEVGTARFRGRTCDLAAEWEVLTVADAFGRYAGIDLLATAGDAHAPDPAALAAEAARIGVRTGVGDRWDDIFFRILLDRIEPRLGMDRPTFLSDYPVSMAALARPKPEDPRLAERFELYICGLELANAFGELTDPAEQRARFEADMALKEQLYGERYPIDEDFLAALASMPPAAGIALGFDRLVMVLTGADDITEVLWAPAL